MQPLSPHPHSHPSVLTGRCPCGVPQTEDLWEGSMCFHLAGPSFLVFKATGVGMPRRLRTIANPLL